MHGLDVRGAAVNRGRFHEPGRFGRMFPHLRSLTEFEPGPERLGRKGGPMDGGAPPPPIPTEQTNPRITAGFTFLGQFIDHDITFDPTSALERQNDPEAIRNFRTPVLELDSLYGAGPSAQPYLYDPDRPGAFAIAHLSDDEGNGRDDLPRAQGSKDPAKNGPRQTAIIGDPRNDENLIVSQLHLAFMKFHNVVLRDEVRDQPPSRRFEEAQRIVRWHYQWMILHEFLPLTCGEEVVKDVLTNGRSFFHFEDEPFMPVEFSVAAYRFGHSQVRPGYRLGTSGGPIFGDSGADLRGNRELPKDLVIDWSLFFGEADDVQFGMRIDTKLARPLLDLPETVVPREPRTEPVTDQPVLNVEVGAPINGAERSLAVRNLKRGLSFRLPSGQAVARYMAPVGIKPLSEKEIWEGVEGGKGPAPLWFYILREAEKRAGGQHLHGVGARIVAEVLFGLIEGDLASFLNHDPAWKPDLGQCGTFGMSDLLRVASRPPKEEETE